MTTRLLSGKHRLTAGDLLYCAKEPWERAFNLTHCLRAWEKIGVSPFTRKVYWDLKAADDKRQTVAQRASIDPKLLTIEGMVRTCFPDAQQPPPAQAVAADGEEAPAPGPKKRSNVNLHSTDLWHLKGGATGDECFALVKEKTEANLAKAEKAEHNKKQRAEARKDKHRASNELGAKVCETIQSEADITKLRVPQLKAVLAYKGVAFEKLAKKADLTALLAREMRGSYSASFVAGTSAEVEPTAADFVDSSDEAASDCGSESSEWPHSEADDH